MIRRLNSGYLVLLFTAALFGLAFVFQRHAAAVTSTFWFIFWRFLIASVALGACWWGMHLKRGRGDYGRWLFYGIISGLFMFGGMFFQQSGLAVTSAGKSGFLTGLYVVLVPLFALFAGQRGGWLLWLAVALSLLGLVFFALGGTAGDFSGWNKGDSLTLLGTVCWALQVLWMGVAVRHANVLAFSVAQLSTVAVLSFILIILTGDGEQLLRGDWMRYAFWDVAATGIGSSAIAFFLQAVGQRQVSATPAAIILSLEAVFALFFGWWLLSETVSAMMLAGCVCMFVAMLVASLKGSDPTR